MYYPHYDPYFYGRTAPYPYAAVPPHDLSKSPTQLKREVKIRNQ